jgi:hypothetical protein
LPLELVEELVGMVKLLHQGGCGRLVCKEPCVGPCVRVRVRARRMRVPRGM